MALDRVLLDSAVFIYTVGVEHPYREPCRLLLQAVSTGALDGEASVLAIEETVHQRTRRTGDRASAERIGRAILALCPVHELTRADTDLALALFAASGRLDVRDALHAATARNRGIATIISPDPAFDGVASLTRLDPSAAAALL